MAEFRVTAPVEGYTGVVCGVVFQDGAAVVSEEHRAALSYFRRRGYGVEPVAVESETERAPRRRRKTVQDDQVKGPEEGVRNG